MHDDPRSHSPAAERNRAPILAQLQRLLPASGVLLEVASGTGQHAAHCAAAMPGWRWWPSDPEPRSWPSIAAWCDGVPNVAAALPLDVLHQPWPGVPAQVDAIFNANMLHISPWPTCAALMQGAARHLAASGVLLLYGPFLRDDENTAPSNLAFDADLRARDSRWGIRRLVDVQAQAAAMGLVLTEPVPMPANNLLLVFRRAAAAKDAA
jgi:Protein of unknown function (DUF938)